MGAPRIKDFPQPSRTGRYWQAFTGERRLLDPATASAVGKDVLHLVGMISEESGPWWSTGDFDNAEDGTYQMLWCSLKSNADFSDYLFRPTRKYAAIRREIPRLLETVAMVENALNKTVGELVINSIPKGGSLGNHCDIGPSHIVAIDLIGRGRVTMREGDELRWFTTNPGDAFAIRNVSDRALRPEHGVRSLDGPRLSIAI